MMISIPTLRKLTRQILVTASDFDAFCHDYYLDIYRRFTNGMDRVQKETELFSQAASPILVQRLYEYAAAKVPAPAQRGSVSETPASPVLQVPAVPPLASRATLQGMSSLRLSLVCVASFLVLVAIALASYTALRQAMLSHPAMGLMSVMLGAVWIGSGSRWAARNLDTRRRYAQQQLYDEYLRAYLRQVRLAEGVFNTRGLLTLGQANLRLAQVFVELRVAQGIPMQASSTPFIQQAQTGGFAIFDWLRLAVPAESVSSSKTEHPTLVLLGPPGSGKTTLLQHLTLTVAQGSQRQHGLAENLLVPLLLYLRDHATAICAETGANPLLSRLITDYLAERAPDLVLPANFFERALENGQCLVLLDGFDEVGDQQQRQRVGAWIEAQIRGYRDNRFLLSARPGGYKLAPLSGVAPLIILETQPLNQEQVRRFIERFYLAEEAAVALGRSREEIQRMARLHADDLLKGMRERQELAEYAQNPLLLTMIVLVHKHRRRREQDNDGGSRRTGLPNNRVELYDEICSVLLEEWQRGKGLPVAQGAAQVRAVIEPIAAFLMSQRRRDIDTEELLAAMVARPRTGEPDSLMSDGFLYELQKHGLLLEREKRLWSFAHLSLQEYLAAAHFRATGLPPNLDTLVADSWWHETLRLYVGMKDGTEVLRSCLNVGSDGAFILAGDCLDEARFIDGKLRQEAEERLIAALETNDPHLFARAAQVKLRRSLRTMVKLKSGASILPSFISNAEYQFFLDETRAVGNYDQPEHWLMPRFRAGTARHPVRGMAPDSAERFCEWLSLRFSREQRAGFRLPTCEEAREVSASATVSAPHPLGTWSLGNGRLYLSELAEHGVLLQEVNKYLGKQSIADSFTKYNNQQSIFLGDEFVQSVNLNFHQQNGTIVLSFLLDWARTRNFEISIERSILSRTENECIRRLEAVLRAVATGLGWQDLITATNIVEMTRRRLNMPESVEGSAHLECLIKLIEAKNPIARRTAARQFLSGLLRLQPPKEGIEQILGLRFKVTSLERRTDLFTHSALDDQTRIYAYCVIQLQRERGQGPEPWEGLRFVKDSPSTESQSR